MLPINWKRVANFNTFEIYGISDFFMLHFGAMTLLLLLLLLKKVGSARLRESDVHPISLKTPAPQYHTKNRKKRN